MPAPEADIDVKKPCELSGEENRIIAEWTEDLFGEEERKHEWAKPDWVLLVKVRGELASHLAITDRVVKVAGESLRVGGIGGVMTPMEWQGNGLAKVAMRRAAEFIRGEMGADFGFLLCSEPLIRFYARLGWRHVPGPVIFEQSTGQEVWDEEAMILPAKRIRWPQGPIDMAGKPW